MMSYFMLEDTDLSLIENLPKSQIITKSKKYSVWFLVLYYLHVILSNNFMEILYQSQKMAVKFLSINKTGVST